MTCRTNENGPSSLASTLGASLSVARVGSWRAPPGLPIRAEMASPESPEGTAVAVRRMRLAAEPFVGRDAAREAANTIGSVLVCEPDQDVYALALSSLRRLQGGAQIRGGGARVVVGADVDLVSVAIAMSEAWRSAR
jgi:hypothetical protein